MATKRYSTDYPGVYYRISKRLAKPGQTERVYYITFKQDGKKIEERVPKGRQFSDKANAFKSNAYRIRRITGKEISPKEKKAREATKKQAELDKWTISKLWTQYKEDKPGLKGIVTDQNRFDLYLKPNFGNKAPSEIISLDVSRLKVKLLKKKSLGTVKNILELLRRLINYGTKKNLCEGIKFIIEMPKLNNVTTENLTPGQLSDLLEAIKESDNKIAANMMLTALYCGLRRGEMFRLKWTDIDFDRSFIHLRDPKGEINQEIPLNNSVKKVFDSIPRTSDFVFPGKNGGQRVDIKKGVNKIKDAANLPKNFRALHGLRHTFASMLAGEVDLYTLQKLLTHQSPAMTMRYAHLGDEAMKSASDLAGDIISKAIEESRKKKVVNLKR